MPANGSPAVPPNGINPPGLNPFGTDDAAAWAAAAASDWSLRAAASAAAARASEVWAWVAAPAACCAAKIAACCAAAVGTTVLAPGVRLRAWPKPPATDSASRLTPQSSVRSNARRIPGGETRISRWGTLRHFLIASSSRARR
ncbi:hypothetical protein ACVWZ3_001875 [Bradyrhizobium sp. i1.3.6]